MYRWQVYKECLSSIAEIMCLEQKKAAANFSFTSNTAVQNVKLKTENLQARYVKYYIICEVFYF